MEGLCGYGRTISATNP
uniref:Uncharacterized protein n=1 Tax=Rhizophora mucronata TaxID=61149 RepID=A0A2P2JYU9_RHIMU